MVFRLLLGESLRKKLCELSYGHILKLRVSKIKETLNFVLLFLAPNRPCIALGS